jgi:hypothetical protein
MPCVGVPSYQVGETYVFLRAKVLLRLKNIFFSQRRDSDIAGAETISFGEKNGTGGFSVANFGVSLRLISERREVFAR